VHHLQDLAEIVRSVAEFRGSATSSAPGDPRRAEQSATPNNRPVPENENPFEHGSGCVHPLHFVNGFVQHSRGALVPPEFCAAFRREADAAAG